MFQEWIEKNKFETIIVSAIHCKRWNVYVLFVQLTLSVLCLKNLNINYFFKHNNKKCKSGNPNIFLLELVQRLNILICTSNKSKFGIPDSTPDKSYCRNIIVYFVISIEMSV